MPNWTQDDYIKAYRFAADRHNNQKYPGTDLPYIMHLSFVCMETIAALRVSAVAEETVAVQCALLHDVIEDTPTTYDEVKQVSPIFKPHRIIGRKRRLPLIGRKRS
jgi:(p)ppGpp synthase/HD superfamily hydrolase